MEDLKGTHITRMQLLVCSWREPLRAYLHQYYVAFNKLDETTTCFSMLLIGVIIGSDILSNLIIYQLHKLDKIFCFATWSRFYQ